MTPSALRILAVEPWLGGSHERCLASWRRHSRHAIEVVGLSGRHWRWRLRDGARALAMQLGEREPPDVLWASDYLDLPTFYGFLPGRWADVPCVYMFHENQLTYPALGPALGEAELDAGEHEPASRDLHHAYTHVLSALRAARVVFNSSFHRTEFAAAAERFLRRLPRGRTDGAPRRAFAAAIDRSLVVHPGVELDDVPLGCGPPADRPLAIAFPHRFEHDKDPAALLAAAECLASRGVRFELHLFGERFASSPPSVAQRLAALSRFVAHDGFVPSFAGYARALGRCDVVVSTARHEFYGLAVLEAVAAGARPLVPDRLSYPELFPTAQRWSTSEELVDALARCAGALPDLRRPAARSRVRALAKPHHAAAAAARLDTLCADARSDPPCSDRVRNLQRPPS